MSNEHKIFLAPRKFFPSFLLIFSIFFVFLSTTMKVSRMTFAEDRRELIKRKRKELKKRNKERISATIRLGKEASDEETLKAHYREKFDFFDFKKVEKLLDPIFKETFNNLVRYEGATKKIAIQDDEAYKIYKDIFKDSKSKEEKLRKLYKLHKDDNKGSNFASRINILLRKKYKFLGGYRNRFQDKDVHQVNQIISKFTLRYNEMTKAQKKYQEAIRKRRKTAEQIEGMRAKNFETQEEIAQLESQRIDAKVTSRIIPSKIKMLRKKMEEYWRKGIGSGPSQDSAKDLKKKIIKNVEKEFFQSIGRKITAEDMIRLRKIKDRFGKKMDEALEEFYYKMLSTPSNEGDIYKGRPMPHVPPIELREKFRRGKVDVKSFANECNKIGNLYRDADAYFTEKMGKDYKKIEDVRKTLCMHFAAQELTNKLRDGRRDGEKCKGMDYKKYLKEAVRRRKKNYGGLSREQAEKKFKKDENKNLERLWQKKTRKYVARTENIKKQMMRLKELEKVYKDMPEGKKLALPFLEKMKDIRNYEDNCQKILKRQFAVVKRTLSDVAKEGLLSKIWGTMTFRPGYAADRGLAINKKCRSLAKMKVVHDDDYETYYKKCHKALSFGKLVDGMVATMDKSRKILTKRSDYVQDVMRYKLHHRLREETTYKLLKTIYDKIPPFPGFKPGKYPPINSKADRSLYQKVKEHLKKLGCQKIRSCVRYVKCEKSKICTEKIKNCQAELTYDDYLRKIRPGMPQKKDYYKQRHNASMAQFNKVKGLQKKLKEGISQFFQRNPKILKELQKKTKERISMSMIPFVGPLMSSMMSYMDKDYGNNEDWKKNVLPISKALKNEGRKLLDNHKEYTAQLAYNFKGTRSYDSAYKQFYKKYKTKPADLMILPGLLGQRSGTGINPWKFKIVGGDNPAIHKKTLGWFKGKVEKEMKNVCKKFAHPGDKKNEINDEISDLAAQPDVLAKVIHDKESGFTERLCREFKRERLRSNRRVAFLVGMGVVLTAASFAVPVLPALTVPLLIADAGLSAYEISKAYKDYKRSIQKFQSGRISDYRQVEAREKALILTAILSAPALAAAGFKSISGIKQMLKKGHKLSQLKSAFNRLKNIKTLKNLTKNQKAALKMLGIRNLKQLNAWRRFIAQSKSPAKRLQRLLSHGVDLEGKQFLKRMIKRYNLSKTAAKDLKAGLHDFLKKSFKKGKIVSNLDLYNHSKKLLKKQARQLSLLEKSRRGTQQTIMRLEARMKSLQDQLKKRSSRALRRKLEKTRSILKTRKKELVKITKSIRKVVRPIKLPKSVEKALKRHLNKIDDIRSGSIKRILKEYPEDFLKNNMDDIIHALKRSCLN